MRQITITFLSILLIALTACRQQVTLVHETDEPFRSVYHHTPEANWMNDPNGMFYDEANGTWHLYFQYYPDGTVWGPMHWGHSVSQDLIHWQYMPVAIYPDSIGMIFSGSCVIDKDNTAGFGANAVVAIYTSAAETQRQSIAYSTDGGTTFTPYEGNPVLEGDIADFRDPKVFWNDKKGCWTMVLACQQELRFYSSADLKHWSLTSRFGHEYGCHGGVWECPDLFELRMENGESKIEDSKWVLICNINPGGPFGGSATQYFVGDWDGETFTCMDSSEECKWLDYGKDHYATVTWHRAPNGRVVALGWMSNWQYATIVPTVAFRSQNTVARDLSLYIDNAGEYRVRVMPSPEMMALKGQPVNRLPDAAVVELELNGDAVITLSNDKGEKVTMTLSTEAQTFTMDRTEAGDCSFSQDFAAVTTTPLFVKQDTYRVTLFIDHCSLEAFDANGYWAMTNLVFPSEPYNRMDVQGGKATIFEIKN